MRRRDFAAVAFPGLAAPVALQGQQTYEQRTKSLPPLKITDVKVIATSGGRNYRWIFVKILTSEPGLYGIGSAGNHYQPHAVIAAIETSLKPFLIGKDPARIEDLWASSHLRTYWRNGPVNNCALSGMDMALWDIKGKRAQVPVYELLGGKARDGVPCYDHAGGNSFDAAAESVQKSLEKGFRYVRVQMGNYGGGGFIPKGEGQRPEGGYQGPAFDEEQYVDQVPKLFEHVRSKVGFGPKLCHDVHSHLTGINAVEFSKRVESSRMYFIEDVLPPEHLQWYRQIRQVSTTPHAVGEVFSHPLEIVPLITERLIDFMRCRVSAMGGITPVKKLATLCEFFGVKTAFQEGGENDPVNQMAAFHIDISSPAFGIQEENAFPEVAREMLPGTAEIRKGYLYGGERPGIGVDLNEELAAKHPLRPIANGGIYGTDRTLDGAVVKP